MSASLNRTVLEALLESWDRNNAIVCAPWRGVTGPAIVWGIIGVSGVVYEVIVGRRMRSQTAYKPQFEDDLFHLILPFAAYATLGFSAWEVRSRASEALFAVAASTLLLLFVGIHNAWDAVTYHVFVGRTRKQPGTK